MVRKRPLTPEEKLLWKHVTRNDKPLSSLRTKGEEVQENPLSRLRGRVREGVVQQPSQPKIVPPPRPSPASGRGSSKTMGDYAGIDRNTAENFRKGDAVIDGKLDLHGMNREKAHPALVSFILKHVKKESRRLLVITGKGSGILKASLPNWLAAPNLSGYILAYDVAQAKHGGSGAYYILLKRKRANNDA